MKCNKSTSTARLPSTRNLYFPLVRAREKKWLKIKRECFRIFVNPALGCPLYMFVGYIRPSLKSRATVFVRICVGFLCLIKPHAPQEMLRPGRLGCDSRPLQAITESLGAVGLQHH